MYTFTVTQEIAAPAARVWRALCDPAEVVQWDSGVTAALDAPPNYPKPGQRVRWRCRGGWFRVLYDEPQEVVPQERLRARLRRGPFCFDETYTLQGGSGTCCLSATLHVRCRTPLMAAVLERHYVGPRTQRAVVDSLRTIKSHCERHPA